MQIIGIDIGTTKIAAVLLQLPENTLVKVLSRENHSRGAQTWEKTQDPEKIIDTAYRLLDELKNSSGEAVGSIGISSQMHGFLYVDRLGHACSPLFTWQDARAVQALEDGRTAQDLIQEQTGHSIPSGYALASHYYNWRKGLLPQGPYQMLSIGAYLAMRLCGSPEACADPSEAASFGLYDLGNQVFFLEEIDRLWGGTSFLPRLVPFYHQVGRERDGIPVFQSLGDNQASFYAAVQQDAGLVLNLGTGGQITFQADAPNKILKGMEVRPSPHGDLVVGATLAGGQSYELLVEFFGDVLAFFGTGISKEEIYQIIQQKIGIDAGGLPDSGLRVEPYFYGTRQQAQVRGAIQNIGAANLRVPGLVYAFSQAIVQELKDLWLANGLGTKGKPQKIVGTGNAIRRNPIIRQMIEASFQAELLLSDLREEAACGAAWYAWQGYSQGPLPLP